MDILALALIHLRKGVKKDERGIMKNRYRKQLIELASSIMNAANLLQTNVDFYVVKEEAWRGKHTFRPERAGSQSSSASTPGFPQRSPRH